MLTIYNLREEFYQWDTNQKLIVVDNNVKEVHFCNRTGEKSLVVEVYEFEGYRVVDVPNILLQTNYPIRAYEYCGECYTKKEYVFKVNSRTKPIDYVYTETEVKSWEALETRVNAALDGLEDVVDRVNAEVKKIEDADFAGQLADKASKEYVDNAVANAISEDEVNALIDTRITGPLNEVNAKIETKATQEDLNNLQQSIEQNVTSKITQIESTLENKASTEYVNEQVATKASTDYVDNAIANAITTALNKSY